MKLDEVQTAVYAILGAHAGLMAIASAIYDDVPQRATFPYVVIGDTSTVPFDTATSVGDEQAITIHTWSRYAGRAEIRQMQEQVYAALNRNALSTVTGAIDCEQEMAQDFLDPDGMTRHGVQRFRVQIDGA